MTIRWKISLLVLVSVLATVLPASYIMFQQTSTQIRQQIDSQLANKLSYFEHIIHTNEAHTQRTTITIAQALEVRKALHLHSSLGLNALLNRNASTYPMFNYILIVDLNHEVFAATTRDKLQNRLPSEQILGNKVERFNKANLLNLGANSAPPSHDIIKSLLGLNDDESQWFSAPVLKKGTPIGWVIVSYDWHSELNKTLRSSENKLQSLDTNIETTLTTVSNRIIAGKQPRGKKWSQPAGTLMKEKSILLGSKPFLLKVSVPESLIATPLRQSAEHIMFVTLGIIAVVLALLYILIEQVFLKRLIQLQEGAIAIKIGKLNHKIPNLGKDELGSLSTTFNEMSTSLYELNTQLEREVHSRTAELLRSNEELDNFAYVASHDLKAPLRAIDNLATWIQEDLDELANPETKEHLRLLQGRIYRMEKLLEDLLEYSRIGRKEEHVKAVDCEVLVQETFSLMPAMTHSSF